MDIKRKGDDSLFVRTSPGRYTLRTLVSATAPASIQPMSAIGARKPAAPATSSSQPQRARTDSDVGNGFVG
jgi:hypothetical protein